MAHFRSHPWVIKYILANSALFLSETQGEIIFLLLYAQIKNGKLLSVPCVVKWCAKDTFRHNKAEIWDLETHTTSVSGHLERFGDYMS